MRIDLKKYLKYIIPGAVVVIALILAFIFGGRAPQKDEAATPTPQVTETAAPEAETEKAAEEETEAPQQSAEPETAKHIDAPEKAKQTDAPKSAAEPEHVQQAEQESVQQAEPEYEPADAPQPEPAAVEDKKTHSCTITVRCDTILDNLKYLDPAKAGLIPASGVILPEQTVEYNEGESVFDVTLRAMQSNKIHFEFSKTPAYNSVYIEGINNIYEFDCGELSGWMYRVNGVFHNYGCSLCTVADGDRIEWLYSCDMGADLGKTF